MTTRKGVQAASGRALTQPLKWHGGKHYLAKKIISMFPPKCCNPNNPASDDPGYVHYVEPYFGGGSVLLQNDPAGISEVVNDLNGDLVNFWQTIADAEAIYELALSLATTPFSEMEFDRAYELLHDPDWEWMHSWTRAAAFFIVARQSRQGLMKDFATMTRNRTRRGMNEQVSSWLGAIEGLPAVHERLKRVVIYNKPAIEVIRQQDGPRTLFYLDPPYLHETRVTTSDYSHEMSPEDHMQLLIALDGIKGRFILSGYPSTMYDDYARCRGWHRVDIEIDNKASGKKTKDKKTECLWMNTEAAA